MQCLAEFNEIALPVTLGRLVELRRKKGKLNDYIFAMPWDLIAGLKAGGYPFAIFRVSPILVGIP